MCKRGGKNMEEHIFHNCERLVNYSMPQPSLGFWHNIELYKAEDGNYYACCDMRFLFGIRIENTIVRCETEELGRKFCDIMEYNKNYVEFRNHPYKFGAEFIYDGGDTAKKFEFIGEGFDKVMNINSSRDKLLGQKK